jgi:excisionase family DNA binding protein
MRCLPVSEVAERLGLTVKTVRKLIASRQLASHRVGRAVRVAERDLEAYLGRVRVPARGEVGMKDEGQRMKEGVRG